MIDNISVPVKGYPQIGGCPRVKRGGPARFIDTVEGHGSYSRGITIKAKAVRLHYERQGVTYELNLIDTPGHVDFHYEVSRALACCEGALLVVDASQGVEAQTVANAFAAMEANLTIVPVINKIDLPSAHPDDVAEELGSLLGIPADEIPRISAKGGINAEAVLEAVVRQVPPPRGDENAPLQALIFDSQYDSYKGVGAYVPLVSGRLTSAGAPSTTPRSKPLNKARSAKKPRSCIARNGAQ